MPTTSKRLFIGQDAGKVLIAVEAIRSRYHACTVTAVGEQLGWNRSSAYTRICELEAMGLLAMTPLPGSIHVTEKGHQAMVDTRLRARSLGLRN